MYKDLITSFYKNTNLLIKKKKANIIDISDYTLINYNPGVGDSLMLFLFDKNNPSVKNINVSFNQSIYKDLLKYNSYISTVYTTTPNKPLFICKIQEYVDCNGGHFLQKIQHTCGLNVQTRPRPLLNNIFTDIKNRVVMSFDKGAVPQHNIHPRARILYPEHKQTIQQFINNNLNKYTFVEVGRTFSGLQNVENKTNLGIEKTTQEIAYADFYFGMHNGLMHIAAGFNKKSIIIINFPSAKHLYLPCLSEINLPDVDWLYPQNVHLHEDDDGELVKFLTYKNIEKAFNGELYPFFAEEYLNI